MIEAHFMQFLQVAEAPPKVVTIAGTDRGEITVECSAGKIDKRTDLHRCDAHRPAEIGEDRNWQGGHIRILFNGGQSQCQNGSVEKSDDRVDGRWFKCALD